MNPQQPDTTTIPQSPKPQVDLDAATVRFCGDSGDGMQLAGTQLTNTSALVGNDVATFPDFPAEIRAPRGTRAGVSGFQIRFASRKIFTPGDQVDALVAMNPAALVTNLADLVRGGITEKDLLVHDERAVQPSLAYLLSRMHYPDFPEPIGVFRAVDRPKYDERLNDQVAEAIRSQGPGDLDKLFHSGDTWVVP